VFLKEAGFRESKQKLPHPLKERHICQFIMANPDSSEGKFSVYLLIGRVACPHGKGKC
jgi:hypothetical protein